MQIIPHLSSSSPIFEDELSPHRAPNTTDAESFADYLLAQQEAQRAVDEGIERSVTTALQALAQPSTPLQEAPYTVKSKTDAGTYTLEEVCFSKTELVELREKLIDAGAPTQTLEKFDKLVNQPDGATMAQVMASLHKTQSPISLSDDDKNALTSLLQKIDGTGALEEKVMGLLQSGQGLAAWNILSQTLTGLDPSKTFSIDKSEIAVLGKALGLSGAGQQQLLAGFGNTQNLELTATQCKQLLSPAQSDLVQREADQKKLNAAFTAVVDPILQKARKRMQNEKDAASRQSRQVEQSKIMIHKTVTTTARNTVETTAVKPDQTTDTGEKTSTIAKDAPADTAKLAAQNKGESAAEHLAAPLRGDIPKTPEVQNTPTTPHKSVDPDNQMQNRAQAHLLRDNGNMSDERNAADNKKSSNTGWEALLNKVETRTQKSQPTTATQSMTGNIQGVHTGLLASGATTTATGTPNHIARHVASQVEQAMLSAMRDGSKKLELQLNPVDLGSLTLTLTTRNGEVSAIIRSERTETADLMIRQLDMLRTNLEQQGIKVDKLEVQTQAQNQQNTAWNGMQQHNSQQEEHARREQLDRIRNLGRVRNTSTNAHDITLEQGLQITARTAENAAQSLHIVA
ncbi:MAG: flagellar hook-length control protein FliK [Desulfovibrionaceae bacterium]